MKRYTLQEILDNINSYDGFNCRYHIYHTKNFKIMVKDLYYNQIIRSYEEIKEVLCSVFWYEPDYKWDMLIYCYLGGY